jgi:hypothetical protein
MSHTNTVNNTDNEFLECGGEFEEIAFLGILSVAFLGTFGVDCADKVMQYRGCRNTGVSPFGSDCFDTVFEG